MPPSSSAVTLLPFRLGAAGLAALLLAACSSSPMSRIDANRSVYESWPVEVQDAVLHNRAIAGMTPEQVEMAMGKPTEITSRAGKDGPEEVWVYKKSSSTSSVLGGLPRVNVGMGTNVGGVGVGSSVPIGGGGGRSRRPADSDDDEIVFKNGAVIRGT
jgi:hypothetical protein